MSTSISMYQASVPVFQRALANLSVILDKAVAFAEAKKIDPAVLISARLAPDMFPLAKQVQIVSDVVKGAAGRLADIELPSFPDTETTFAELQRRIAQTRDFLAGIQASKIDGSEERTITLKMSSGDLTFSGQSYLLTFVLPNLFFHVTTTYAILRHNGVEIGKKDFLGSF
jgi:hypothetical protein